MSISKTLFRYAVAVREENFTPFHLNEKVISLEDLGESIQVQTESETFFSDRVVLSISPRLTANLDMRPPLTLSDLQTLSQIQIWMGNSAKYVVVYKKAVWREKNLSGFVFSHKGPLGEIHDASTSTQAAVFGFLHAHEDMKILIQMFEYK